MTVIGACRWLIYLILVVATLLILLVVSSSKVLAQSCDDWRSTYSSLEVCSTSLFGSDCTGSNGYTGTECCTGGDVLGGPYDYCEEQGIGIYPVPLKQFRCCRNENPCTCDLSYQFWSCEGCNVGYSKLVQVYKWSDGCGADSGTECNRVVGSCDHEDSNCRPAPTGTGCTSDSQCGTCKKCCAGTPNYCSTLNYDCTNTQICGVVPPPSCVDNYGQECGTTYGCCSPGNIESECYKQYNCAGTCVYAGYRNEGEYCGNGVCSCNETCSSCSKDCGCCPYSFVSGSTSPSSVSQNSTFTVKCNYGVKDIDCIQPSTGASTGSCSFTGWNGVDATFSCTASNIGTFTTQCNMKTGTSSNCCANTGDAGSITVTTSSVPVFLGTSYCKPDDLKPYVGLSWTQITGNTGYVLKRCLAGGASCQEATLPQNRTSYSYTDGALAGPLSFNTYYIYYVAAKLGAVYSAWSLPYDLTTPLTCSLSCILSANPSSGIAPLLVNFSAVVNGLASDETVSSGSWTFKPGAMGSTVPPNPTSTFYRYTSTGIYSPSVTFTTNYPYNRTTTLPCSTGVAVGATPDPSATPNPLADICPNISPPWYCATSPSSPVLPGGSWTCTVDSGYTCTDLGTTPRQCYKCQTSSPPDLGWWNIDIKAYHDKNRNSMWDEGEEEIQFLPVVKTANNGFSVTYDRSKTPWSTVGTPNNGWYNITAMADASVWTPPVGGGTKVKSADADACGCAPLNSFYQAFGGSICWEDTGCQLDLGGGIGEDPIIWCNGLINPACWDNQRSSWPEEYWKVTKGAYYNRAGYVQVFFPFTKLTDITPWIQVWGDVHSNTGINASGGP